MTDLPAGPELDRLVAERVMGWVMRPDGTWANSEQIAARLTDDPHAVFYDEYGYPNWSPSTNIAHAWEAVVRITEGGNDFTVDFTRPSYWRAWTNMPKGHGADADADTAPLAICRAALKAMA